MVHVYNSYVYATNILILPNNSASAVEQWDYYVYDMVPLQVYKLACVQVCYLLGKLQYFASAHSQYLLVNTSLTIFT